MNTSYPPHRRDWFIFGWRIIKRNYHDSEYGVHAWGKRYGWTYDMYLNHTLWTVTRDRRIP